jgi:hypothetical protein
MERFAIGEIAIYDPPSEIMFIHEELKPFVGADVEVIERPVIRYQLVPYVADAKIPRYAIKLPNGIKAYVFEKSLRKKPRPGNEAQTRSFNSLICWCKKAGRKNKVAEQA